MDPVSFRTHPSRYVHWNLEVDGQVARATMNVQPDKGLREGYELKLNSYDLGVDIELADLVRRLRFEHPNVNTVVVTSGHMQAFCAGANIHMLGASSHQWKVNFCKFTNETRCELEDLSQNGDFRSLCAVNGPCAGGGYELALACDEIALVDDGNSAVSLPEVPLLGVLPGTGGLTRLVDKRKVRRDRSDVFCTLAEGMKGKKALDWKLVDHIATRSKFEDMIQARVDELVAQGNGKTDRTARKGIELTEVQSEDDGSTRKYRSVTLARDAEARTAELTITMAPASEIPADAETAYAQGANFWFLQLARDLEDAILDMRVNHNDVGLVNVKTVGSLDDTLAWDKFLVENREHWFIDSCIWMWGNVLRRVERTASSFFALIVENSCSGGFLHELAMTCDRTYMLDEDGIEIALSPMNFGLLPMTTDVTRLQCRLLGEESVLAELEGDFDKKDAQEAEELGLVTEALDEIDFEDEVRIAIEERASLSPDSLTGMEANLRFAGVETTDSKIYGRLTAWQNWIFIRPNATGPTGALTLYGKPERPTFDWNRV